MAASVIVMSNLVKQVAVGCRMPPATQQMWQLVGPLVWVHPLLLAQRLRASTEVTYMGSDAFCLGQFMEWWRAFSGDSLVRA